MQLEAFAPMHWDGMREGRWNPTTILIVVSMVLAACVLLGHGAMAGPVAEAGPPVQDFTGRPVVLEGVGTPDAGNRIILYEWDFDGDGTIDWNSTMTGRCTRKYWEVGQFNATLRVTQYNSSEDLLLTDTDATTVGILSGRPVGNIVSSTTAQVDTPHLIEAVYHDPDGGILSYTWRIDGELTSNESSFETTFAELGKRNVTLIVTDDEGETAEDQVIIGVVEELEEESDYMTWVVAIGIVLVLAIIAMVAYRSILKGQRDDGPRGPLAYIEVGGTSSEIVQEASLADREQERPRAAKPRVVRPERVLASADKAKAREPELAAAPERPPCPECGTLLGQEGICPFCSSNEAIDRVETRVRQLQSDGFIIAKAEEELEVAKAELHVKNFEGVTQHLEASEDLIEEAVREHERCLALMVLVDQLIEEAKDRDLDVSKAVNLVKLSKSFMKSGKYPKAVYYAERSRDYLLDTLEPFDLDRYFCEHCKGEVGYEDDQCPHCEREIESGFLRRVKRDLAELVGRFEAIGKDHASHQPIAAQLEKAHEHVDTRSATAASENIARARKLLDDIDVEVRAARERQEDGGAEDGRRGEGDPEGTPDDAGGVPGDGGTKDAEP